MAFFYLGFMNRFFIKPRFLFIILLCLIVLSCNTNNNKTTTNTSVTTTESITSWINTNSSSSLQKALDYITELPNDSLKRNKLRQISKNYLNKKDSINFRETNKELFLLSNEAKDSTNLGYAYWDIGMHYYQNAILDSSYLNFLTAYKVYERIADFHRAGRMMRNIAIVQNDIRDYTGSEISNIKAIELFKTLPEQKATQEQLYYSYNNLAINTKDLGEYERSLEYYDAAIEYLEKFGGSKYSQHIILNNKGNVYLYQENYSKAENNYTEILQDKNLLQEHTGFYARVLDNLAYSNFKAEKLDSVEVKLQRALFIRDSIGSKSTLGLSHYRLAEFYLTQKDTAKSLSHANNAVRFSMETNSNERLLKSYELLTKVNPKNASNYAQSYISLNNNLIQEERSTREKFSRIQFETDELLEKNVDLIRENQLLLSIGMGLTLLGLAIFVIISQRAKNQKLVFQQQQQASNQETFNLMLSQKGELEKVRHDEQKRISEEIHDGILGEMLGSRLILTKLNEKDDEKSKSHRIQLISKLQVIEEDLRTISHELSHSSSQKIQNFINSIEELLNKFSESSGIKHSFHFNKDADWDQIAGETKINLYRIVQEGLQNCVKHAKANHISLKFNSTTKDLSVILSDDGIGFNPKRGRKGIGLKNIISRVDKLNGTLDIISKVGNGTSLDIQIPLNSTINKE